MSEAVGDAVGLRGHSAEEFAERAHLAGRVRVRDDRGERRVSPFLVPMMMANAPTAAVSMRHGLQGPAENTCTACAAGTHAVANAARLVASGRCDVMVAGGSEAAFVPTALAGFRNMTAFSSVGVSRPFDAERDGFVMGEGAGILVLEDWDSATARGAMAQHRACSGRAAGVRPLGLSSRNSIH